MKMAKSNVIQTQGEIVDTLPNATFKVKLENDHIENEFYKDFTRRYRNC